MCLHTCTASPVVAGHTPAPRTPRRRERRARRALHARPRPPRPSNATRFPSAAASSVSASFPALQCCTCCNAHTIPPPPGPPPPPSRRSTAPPAAALEPLCLSQFHAKCTPQRTRQFAFQGAVTRNAPPAPPLAHNHQQSSTCRQFTPVLLRSSTRLLHTSLCPRFPPSHDFCPHPLFSRHHLFVPPHFATANVCQARPVTPLVGFVFD